MSRSYLYTCENEGCRSTVRLTDYEYRKRVNADVALWCPTCSQLSPPPQRMMPLGLRHRKSVEASSPLPISTPTEEDDSMLGLETITRAARTDPHAPLSDNSRDNAGVTVTMREQTTGEFRTIVRAGLTQDALRSVCDVADKLDGDWRITCVSTPRSILGDLHRRGHTDTLGRPVLPVEHLMLGKIGRLDLLERRHTVVAERGQMSMSRQRGRGRKPAA